VLTVPAEAICQSIDRPGALWVWVLSEGRVEAREVVTGVTVDHLTEVKSALAEGEEVVVRGQQFLSEGVAVAVRK
jgi:multidrug efflux pump subunit AcrA (membrane-fusion protein)